MRALSLLSLAAAAAVQAAEVGVAFQLEDIGTWFENLAVRASGSVLATRMDAPEVWHIDPSTNTGAPVVTVPGHLSTTGITELTHDVFVFSAANFSFGEPFGLAAGSMAVWKVDLNEWDGEGQVEPQLVAEFPEAGFLNGMATWDEGRVLVGDSTTNQVYLLDVESGEFETALDGEEVTGVNGIRVHDGAVYVAQTSAQVLYRLPVDADARLDGKAVVIANGGVDDFDVAADGTVYAASPSGSIVVQIGADRLVTTLAGGPESLDVLSCTSVRIGRGEGGENTLYVSTTGNGAFGREGSLMEPAKIAVIRLGGGKSAEEPVEGAEDEAADECVEDEEEVVVDEEAAADADECIEDEEEVVVDEEAAADADECVEDDEDVAADEEDTVADADECVEEDEVIEEEAVEE